MTVSTLRPNGTSTFTGSVTGAANAHTALSDDSDSSYITLTEPQLWQGTLGDLTLPAGAVVRTVAVRARTRLNSGTSGRLNTYLTVGAAPANVTRTVNWSPATTVTMQTINEGGISDAAADAATLLFSAFDTPLDVLEAYVDVTYVAQPVLDVTAPTGTITTTNLPTVVWTNTIDGYGGAVRAFDAKVFTDAQYGAGGFDPGTSASTVSSGITEGGGDTITNGSWQVTATLPDDTYRAYVRTAQIVNGDYHWSEWDFLEFTVDVDLPGTPLFAANASDATGAITLAITDVAGAATTDLYEYQRSLDGGTTWEPVRTLEGDDGYVTRPHVPATGEFSDAADGTSHALVLPAPGGGIRANDLLIAVVGMDGNPTLSWPAGWTEIKDEAGNGSAVRAGVAWKRAVGGESGTVTLTTSASEGGGGRILLVRGADTSTAPEVSTGVNGSGSNADPDTFNPSWADTGYNLFIAAMVNDGNVAVTAGPSGYAGFGNTRWANAAGAGVATAHLVAVGSANPGAFTHTAEDTRAFTIAVRAANFLLLSPTDYEAPNGATTNYRARSLHDYGGVYAASDWVPEFTSWDSASWFLKHPHLPALNMTVTVRSFQAINREGRAGVFQPLGSATAVVVADSARGAKTGQITFRALTEAAQDDFDALVDQQSALLLQSPPGEGGPGYVRFLNHTRERIVDWADASMVWEVLDFAVVAMPPGAVVEWP